MVFKAYYEEQEEEDNPTRTFEGMYRLLSFADAVDSTDGLMESLASQLDGLELHSQLGEQQLVLCPLGFDFVQEDLQLLAYAAGKIDSALVGQPAASSEPMQAFIQQVAAQTEQLLWLAYRLQLEPLAQLLHEFIRSACLFSGPLFRGRADIFTPRVLEAAGASGMTVNRQALINSVLTQEVAFTKAAQEGIAVLEPLTLTAHQQQPRELDAVLHAGVLGIPGGTQVRVRLDLFGTSQLRVNDDNHFVHLRIGRRVT